MTTAAKNVPLPAWGCDRLQTVPLSGGQAGGGVPWGGWRGADAAEEGMGEAPRELLLRATPPRSRPLPPAPVAARCRLALPEPSPGKAARLIPAGPRRGPEGAAPSHRPAPVEGGRWRVAGAGRGCDAGERGRAPVPSCQAAPCPQLQAAPACPVPGRASAVGRGPWLVWLQPGLCSPPRILGFVPEVTCVLALRTGTAPAVLTPRRCVSVSPANPLSLLQPPPSSFCPVTCSVAPPYECTRGVSGGGTGGSGGDTEGE